MIFVSRKGIPAEVSDVLLRPNREGLTELQRARVYYSQAPSPSKAFEFSRYREFEVCQELDRLFHEKCAYCESRYRAVDARQIEHFRPKGGVKESKGSHPGYWWLATVWENLLPSCISCNQRRRHVTYRPGMTIEEFEHACLRPPLDLSGKMDSFPVKDENWVAHEGGDLSQEDPLLIHPCERDPDDHIEWVLDWNRDAPLWLAPSVLALVVPRVKDGVEDIYGNTSIAIYGLNRAGLIRERMRQIRLMQVATEHAMDAVERRLDATSALAAQKADSRIGISIARLRAFASPAEPYAGMGRAYLLRIQQEMRLT